VSCWNLPARLVGCQWFNVQVLNVRLNAHEPLTTDSQLASLTTSRYRSAHPTNEGVGNGSTCPCSDYELSFSDRPRMAPPENPAPNSRRPILARHRKQTVPGASRTPSMDPLPPRGKEGKQTKMADLQTEYVCSLSMTILIPWTRPWTTSSRV
jgi:hypothetical protein